MVEEFSEETVDRKLLARMPGPSPTGMPRL